MPQPAEHSEGTPDAVQNGSARAGGTAAGGVAPQPGDPTSPAEAQARAAATDRALEDGGFGKHDSVAMDKPTAP